MSKVILQIETLGERKTVSLEDELSIGRTNQAQVVLPDTGLSRLNTSFFRDGEAIFAVDENSLNGTFLNGERIGGEPKRIFDGDEIRIGSYTRIRVETAQSPNSRLQIPDSKSQDSATVQGSKFKNKDPKSETREQVAIPQSAIENPQSNAPPFVLIAAVGLMFLIIFLAVVGYFVARRYEDDSANSKTKPAPKIVASAAIPIRVVDPLGGEEPDNLDDLMEAWEVQEATLSDVKDLQAVTSSTAAPQLNVSVADWKKQFDKALEARSAPVGLISVKVPPEMIGAFGKQIAKIQELGLADKLPRDFSSLAQMRMDGKLIELPLATNSYVIDVGGSADDSPFNEFNPVSKQSYPLTPGMPGYSVLSKLAANYDGQTYDLNVASARKNMKRRLLRMFNPAARLILEEIADAYSKQFKRPLLITSLTRSLEYQFELTKVTGNAYKGATPPHTTGCTFDLAYRQMTAEEQNFVMNKIAELVKRGLVNGLFERGATPCYHIFVYPDGRPPRM